VQIFAVQRVLQLGLYT